MSPPRRTGNPRRGAGRPTGGLLGGEQVEGRQAVQELLVAGRRPTRELLVERDADRGLADLVALATDRRVPVREVSDTTLMREARTSAPQGIVARASPLRPAELEELIEQPQPPFLLVVDGVTDPQNLGAILRSAECAGVTGVVLARHRSVKITPAAAKAAAGAIEHLRFALVGGIPATLQQLRDAGVWTLGLDAAGSTPLRGITVAREPVALVLGAEGRGLARLVRERCDQLISIPLYGQLPSLNVGAAAALACFEVAQLRADTEKG